mmetsp:Transcript_49745/g.142345  ORF Transcript_49745/g.142345 Transcript_49745/m.142345 type:complete len:131 (+) Transcript_49745:165-557(+)
MDSFASLSNPAEELPEPNAVADAAEFAPAEEEDDPENLAPHYTTAMLLHCLFAMVFAAATLGVLNCLGLVVSSSYCCPQMGTGYAPCEMWQDFRSVLSFLLGACVCCIVTRNNKHAADSSGKVQLYTCLL